MDDALKSYLDAESRITRWPTRKMKQDRAPLLAYLAAKFALGTFYNEKQVNELLKQWHTFEDWALLRRELIEQGYLQRKADGQVYWRTSGERSYQDKEF